MVLMRQNPPDSLNIPATTVENKNGAVGLINHLMDEDGWSRIVLLRVPAGHEDSEERERGYREVLESHHIEFDRDLIVSGGFDDVHFARYLSPALTTVRAPIEEVGREAVHQLVRQSNGEPAEALILMRTELVIRESCECNSSTDKQNVRLPYNLFCRSTAVEPGQ